MILTLSEKIKHLDEELSEIEFREPTTEDVKKLGYPHIMDINGDPKMDAKKVYQYLTTLSALPPSVCDKISFPDIERFKAYLLVFFLGSREAAARLLNDS